MLKLSKALKEALSDVPADITVAQARSALAARHVPSQLWEELIRLEREHGPSTPLNLRRHRSIDGEPDMPPLPAPPPLLRPRYACVNCGGFHVSERTWLVLNPPPGHRPGQSLLDTEAYDAVDDPEGSNQYYCHDCDTIFSDIAELDEGS